MHATKMFWITTTIIVFLFIANAVRLNSKNEVAKGSLLQKMLDAVKLKSDTNGQIDDLAAKDFRDKSDQANVAAAQTQIEDNSKWIATDYKQGDLKSGNYVVKRGDTLWEIAEAVYGDGTQWHKILDANKGSIGYLPNGSQALIVENQTLAIP